MLAVKLITKHKSISNDEGAIYFKHVNFQRHTQIFRQQAARRPPLVQSVSYPARGHAVRPKPANTGNRVSGKYLVLAVMLIGLLGTFLLWPSNEQKAAEQAAVVQQPEPEPIKQLDFVPMASTINTVIQQYPGMDIGVAVVDIKTGEAQAYGVQVPFVAASTAKLLTAIAYLHDVEQGKLSLTQDIGGRSAQSALEALIVDSDNQAWYDLNNVVMSHAELAEYANQIGFSGYDPDNNTVVPSSLATLLSNLYQHRLLNDTHTGLLLSYMERAKEVEYITGIVPAGVKTYHKPGYLSDRIHDALIIDNNDRPYVLVVFTKSRTASYDTQAGEDVFTRVARATFQVFLQSEAPLN